MVMFCVIIFTTVTLLKTTNIKTQSLKLQVAQDMTLEKFTKVMVNFILN